MLVCWERLQEGKLSHLERATLGKVQSTRPGQLGAP